MIKSFADKLTEDIYNEAKSKNSKKMPINLYKKTARLLDQINASVRVDTLRIPPGNNLEKLGGDFKDYWSIRINSQWRIIFMWLDGDAFDVKITDYH